MATATEWFAEGVQVTVGDEGVDDLASGCQLQADDTEWVCELRYSPADTTASVFALTFGQPAGAVRIIDLSFAGDAG